MRPHHSAALDYCYVLLWPQRSFIALVSGFLDEGSGSEDEEEEEEEEQEEQEEEEEKEKGREGSDASSSSASYCSDGEEEAESRRGRCRPCANSSSSSSCRRGRCREQRSPSPGAADVVVIADKSFPAEDGQKRSPLFAATTRRGLDSARQDDGGCAGGGAGADVDVAGTGELGSRENTRGPRSGAAATACCRERRGSSGGGGSSGDPPGTGPLLSEARGAGAAVGLTNGGKRRSVPELPTRAEGKS